MNAPAEQHPRNCLRLKHRGKPIDVPDGSAIFDIGLQPRSELKPKLSIVFAVAAKRSASRLVVRPDLSETLEWLSAGDGIFAARVMAPNLERVDQPGDPLDRQTCYGRSEEPVVELLKQVESVDMLGLPLSDLRQRVSKVLDDDAIIDTAMRVESAGITYIMRDAHQ
jgi:hypothetical protein